MPFLVDKAPPVDPGTLAALRRDLPREYGVKILDTPQGRVLAVRVPRAKPDYNYELAVVAFYVGLDDIRDLKDVILIGDDKSVRMEPLRLRDHVRGQIREDKEWAPLLRAKLAREFGWTTFQSPSNNHHRALVLRLPIESMGQANEAILLRSRASVGNDLAPVLRDVQYVYFLTDNDYARVGRRVFVEEVASDLADVVAPGDSKTANPLHLGYQTPGHFLTRADLTRM